MKEIGITESGEIAFKLWAFNNLKEANIIITKRLTEKLIEQLILHKNKIILHLTVTGMGGSKLEPFVPSKEITEEYFFRLIELGFPIEQVVLRIDPIIPTEKGLQTALSVIELFKEYKIKRVRISFLDLYNHVKERFDSENIKLPYNNFHAPKNEINKANKILTEKCNELGIDLESCAEDLPNKTGCISQKDINILGLKNEIILLGSSNQRKGCLCPANKKELINGKPKRCENKCLYCFWKD